MPIRIVPAFLASWRSGLAAVALVLAFAAPAAATQEYRLPTLFDVTGVAADDILNVRAGPTAEADIVGTLAPDATRIEVVAHDETGLWAQINTAERTGWVALRYLAYRTDVWTEGALPETLHCFGTEPFWSLAPEGGTVTFSRMGENDVALDLDRTLDPGIFRTPRRAILASGGGLDLTAVLVPAACTDGMSDRAYGLDVTVVIDGADGARLLAGCCSVAPR